MTGEFVPVDRKAGDHVTSGTVNRFGAFTMRAEKVVADSSLQRIVRLVRSADAGRTEIVSLADCWAVWIVIGAATIATLAWLITGDILRAVTVLVVFCPCALVLATPTAIMAAIGNLTRHGILVRKGAALEKLSAVRKIAFDKTSTLTKGRPEVAEILPASGWKKAAILRFAASAESASEHPLAQAVVRAGKTEDLSPAADFAMHPGKGVTGTVDGRAVIRTLTEKGITPHLLTSDGAGAAAFAARNAGLSEDRVIARCHPETKLAFLQKEQEAGRAVAMVGDGVNDAPALKVADVGIAMGGIGSDIAVEAADIVLVKEGLHGLPHLFALSRHMMRIIRANILFSLSLNLLAVTLAVLGILTPVTGAILHNAGSVLVVASSALLLRWREKSLIDQKAQEEGEAILRASAPTFSMNEKNTEVIAIAHR